MKLNEVLNSVKQLLSLSNTKVVSTPSPLVLLSNRRSGLSVTKIVSEILAEKQKLGLTVGTLPNGEQNMDDAMIYVIVEKILHAIMFDANIQVSIKPLGNVTSTGTAADGTPVVTTGVVTSIQTGGCVIK